MTTLPPPPAALSDLAKQAWAELAVGGETPAQLAALECAAVQLARARDAQARIDSEGPIIAGPKGEPIPHPALAIERAAQEQVRRWAEINKRRVRA